MPSLAVTHKQDKREQNIKRPSNPNDHVRNEKGFRDLVIPHANESVNSDGLIGKLLFDKQNGIEIITLQW
jgi:hypothetical protein